MILWLLCCSILTLSSSLPTENSILKRFIESQHPNQFWLASAKAYPDHVIYMNNQCVGGTPFYGAGCGKDLDCPNGFSCMPGKDRNVCCITEESVLPYMQCPGLTAPSSNKYCLSNSDCHAMAVCHKEFDIPEHVIKALDVKYQGKKDPNDNRTYKPIGICCSSRDVSPFALSKCPTNYLSTRYLPCGVTLPGCGLGSTCMYAEDAFGQCCLHKDTAVNLGLKAIAGYSSWKHHGRRTVVKVLRKKPQSKKVKKDKEQENEEEKKEENEENDNENNNEENENEENANENEENENENEGNENEENGNENAENENEENEEKEKQENKEEENGEENEENENEDNKNQENNEENDENNEENDEDNEDEEENEKDDKVKKLAKLLAKLLEKSQNNGITALLSKLDASDEE